MDKNNEDVYSNLREYIDKMGAGFPATESGIEIKILKKIFTPEAARIFVGMNVQLETASVIANRLEMNEPEAARKLDSMSKDGLIFRMRQNDETLYMPLAYIPGFYDQMVKRMDPELAALAEAYYPYLGKAWGEVKTKVLRVVPVGSSVDVTSAVSTYDNIRDLVKDKELIGVAPCVCQKEQSLLGKTCERPSERCIMFGPFAQYYIDNGVGRQISMEELMDLLKVCEDKALVPCPTNAKDVANLCMCCGCCCPWLGALKKYPRPADHVQSPFQARIDSEICIACGVCVERCQMDAIKFDADIYQVDMARCIGCGLCLSTCPAGAVSLVKKAEVAPVPENVMEMRLTIVKERGF